MAPPPAAISGAKSSLRKLLPWYMLYLVVLLVFLVVLVLCSLVYGEEFQPDTFERRSYRLLRLPWLGLQFSSTLRRDIESHDLADHLQRGNWLVRRGAASPWQVVLERSIQGLRVNDVSLLCDALRDDEFWIDWSSEHPEVAERLWPVIVEQARKGECRHLPRLLGLALDCRDEADWKRSLSQWQADRLTP